MTIRSGDTIKDFAAKPTGKPGVYRAEVVFPTAGRWTYQIDDGFISQMPHTYPAGADRRAATAAAAATTTAARTCCGSIPGIALLLAAAALLIRPRLGSRQPQAA